MKKIYLYTILISLIFFGLSLILKQDIYPLLSFLSPFLLLKINYSNIIQYFLFTLFLLIIINLEYLLFVNYMIHPWLQTDPNNCDGACFGWYKFEESTLFNYITHSLLIIFTTILVSLYLHLRKDQ